MPAFKAGFYRYLVGQSTPLANVLRKDHMTNASRILAAMDSAIEGPAAGSAQQTLSRLLSQRLPDIPFA